MSIVTEGRMRRHRLSRPLALGVAALAVTVLLAGCGAATPSASGSASLSGQVVFADYGGPTHESRAAAYFDSFTKKTGVKVTSADYVDAAANTMLEGGKGNYDLIQVSADQLYKYEKNLVKLPASVTRGDTLPKDVQDYAAGGFTIGITQGWLTKTFPDGGPQNWADFFNFTKFPGKRAWPGSAGSYDASFEIALLADGVKPADLYPIDFARAVKKLDELKSHLVFYSSYPEVQQLLSSGTASIAVSVTGQFTALKNAGQDVTVQWNQAFLSPNFFVIPTGAKDKANAYALAQWMTDATRQAVFTKRTLYGPSNSTTFDKLDSTIASELPNSPGNTKTLSFDEKYRAANLDTFLKTYTDWLAQ